MDVVRYALPNAPVVDEVELSPSMLGANRFIWGDDLLAYMLGAGADGSLADWRLASALHDDPSTRARLRVLDDLRRLFRDGRSARAWVRYPHPRLGGQSPAESIRTGTHEHALTVLDLAERECQGF